MRINLHSLDIRCQVAVLVESKGRDFNLDDCQAIASSDSESHLVAL
jgi:hypothetical protein